MTISEWSDGLDQHRLDARVRLCEVAARLEAAGGDWEAKHVCAVLGLSRTTIYNTPWLLKISRRVGRNRLRWTPSEVREAQAAETAARDRRERTTTRRRTA